MEIITYRRIGTGVWGYEFFDPERTQIGFVRNGLSRSAPVMIEAEGISWYSRFGLDYTIVPGTSRKVKDGRDGREVYRIIYWQPGLYQVGPVTGDSVQVEIRDGVYLFGLPEMPATALTRRISEAEWIPSNCLEIEPYFHTVFYENMSSTYLMMVLSFPTLRFY